MGSTPVEAERIEEEDARKVCGVLVSYNPDLSLWVKNISAVLKQVDYLIVVDNGSDIELKNNTRCKARQKICYLNLGENTGVANAYNVGVAKAITLGFDYALLLDQDSFPGQGMVQQLMSVMLSDLTERSALVGPVYKRECDSTGSFFVKIKPHKVTRIYPGQSPDNKIDCSMLISSGSLLRLSAWKVVGEYQSDLFIDHVDTEWCFRAIAAGFHLYGAPSALLFHSLGEESLRLWIFRWRQIPIHVPLRNYYTVRNSFRLYRMGHVPAVWIRHDLRRLLMLLVFSLVFCDRKIFRLKMIFLGGYDGILERAIMPWGKKHIVEKQTT